MRFFLTFLLMMNSVLACPVEPHEFMLSQMRGFGDEVGPSLSGITEDDFKDVLLRVKNHYEPEVKARGLEMEYTLDWANDWFNAQTGWVNEKKIRFFFSGALARGKFMTKDALMYVACHEIGHHFGGLPRKSRWASAEGQADYFAAVKCMRDLLKNDPDNQKALTLEVHEAVQNMCRKVYPDDDDYQICLRTAKAGEDMAKTFSYRRTKSDPGSLLMLEQEPVEKTITSYPTHACRAEIAYQGAICDKGPEIPVSFSSESEGYCHEKNGDTFGMRPKCWYLPVVE